MTAPALTGTRSGTSPASPVSFTTICRVAGYRESLHGRRQDGTGGSIARTPGGLIARNAPFSTLIEMAFQTKLLDLAAVPDSFRSERFDIVAKASEKLSRDQYWEMLRALLEDRFQLKYHRETREAQLYALILAKGKSLGPQISRSANPDCQGAVAFRRPSCPGSDRSGGSFDFRLRSTPDQRQGSPFSPQSRNSSG